ncbi:hypothetical protein EHQ94_19755 [Leptospira meyeri]|nr:hypothetical protein EHQ93_17750 [Leptospira meyeri]TGM62941.1 hypothetical protein EHQ94_19755 [Leptospira meyeri]
MRSQATCQSLTSRSGTQGRGTSVSLVRYAKEEENILKKNRKKMKLSHFNPISYFLTKINYE